MSRQNNRSMKWRCKEPRKRWESDQGWRLYYHDPQYGVSTWVLTGHGRVADMETRELRAAQRLAEEWIKENGYSIPE